MNATQRNALLSRAGATLAEPRTPAQLDKLLERISAGKVARKATGAHPYAYCFSSTRHTHYANGHTSYGTPSAYMVTRYGETVGCVEHITAQEAAKRDKARELVSA